MTDAIGSLPAGTIALTCAIVSATLIIAMAIQAVRAGMRTWRTARAGQALLDVHLAALEERAETAIAKTLPVAERSDDLSDAASQLSDSVRDLRCLLTSVPRERARTRRRILDVLLPTED